MPILHLRGLGRAGEIPGGQGSRAFLMPPLDWFARLASPSSQRGEGTIWFYREPQCLAKRKFFLLAIAEAGLNIKEARAL